MPKLAAFVACERVVFSNDSAPALIRLFQQIEVPPPSEEGPVFEPIRWCLYVLWTHTPDEIGSTYRQTIELVDPRGTIYFEAPLNFEASGVFSQGVLKLNDIPVTFEGTITCRVRLSDGPVSGEFPIEVRYGVEDGVFQQ